MLGNICKRSISDLPEWDITTKQYRDLYVADYHIGKRANYDVQEYRRGSPVWNTDNLEGTLLLNYTNTMDEDIYVLEL